jgi:hypothetical protein
MVAYPHGGPPPVIAAVHEPGVMRAILIQLGRSLPRGTTQAGPARSSLRPAEIRRWPRTFHARRAHRAPPLLDRAPVTSAGLRAAREFRGPRAKGARRHKSQEVHGGVACRTGHDEPPSSSTRGKQSARLRCRRSSPPCFTAEPDAGRRCVRCRRHRRQPLCRTSSRIAKFCTGSCDRDGPGRCTQQAAAVQREVAPGRGAPHDVPRDRHAILAGAGGGEAEGVGVMRRLQRAS